VGPPSIKPIDIDNPLVQEYMTRRKELLAWVSDHLRSCVAVELFLYAKDSLSPFEHTVLFTIDTENPQEISQAREAFELDQPQFPLPTAFLKGRISRGGNIIPGDSTSIDQVS